MDGIIYIVLGAFAIFLYFCNVYIAMPDNKYEVLNSVCIIYGILSAMMGVLKLCL